MSACQGLTPVSPTATLPPPTAEPTLTLEPSPTSTATATLTVTPSQTATITQTPTTTLTPTITATPTITLTPTRDFPDAEIIMQANCRYGPGTAYLYSHGLYPGDPVEVHGRTASGAWLWLQPANLDRHCWAAASVMEVSGDAMTVPVVTSRLPKTGVVGPPQRVRAKRDGNEVTVKWDPITFRTTEEHGYLIEATTCQGGALIWQAVQTQDSEYAFTDEPGCQGESGALVYGFEKHGYTDPVRVDWPEAE